MLLTVQTLFPHVPQFVEINLNEWLKTHCVERPVGAAAYQLEIDRMLGEMQGAAYGGWMEQREWMWSGSYMEAKKNFTHLGVDVYLHRGTPVQLPFPVRVLDTFYNKDDEVGWGGRITVQRDESYPAIVLGHLEKHLPKIGTAIPSGEPIGRLATWPVNGNVFEHLHIQLIRSELVATIDWHELDGYGFPSDATDFPHPFHTEV